MTCTEATREVSRRYGKGLYHASALYREIFQKGRTGVADAPEFLRSPDLARQLAKDVQWPSCRITAQQEDEGVVKFVSTLFDGSCIESVLIPADGRTTLCVSSQVGCRMGCRFCTTGGMGFVRHLSVEEIVWQVYGARFALDHCVDNVVFMGMGEPLDNIDNVLQALRVLSDQRGLDIAPRHMTVSTAGHLEGIRKLAASGPRKLRLAISINAADDTLRSALMPINRRYPLERLKEELLAFPLLRDGLFFIEYVLFAGVNDSPDDAQNLVHYLDGLPVRVNVIAYNAGRSAPYRTPSVEQVQRFCDRLKDAGLFVRVRQSRGQNIAAACGQLGTAKKGFSQ